MLSRPYFSRNYSIVNNLVDVYEILTVLLQTTLWADL